MARSLTEVLRQLEEEATAEAERLVDERLKAEGGQQEDAVALEEGEDKLQQGSTEQPEQTHGLEDGAVEGLVQDEGPIANAPNTSREMPFE